MTESTLPPQPRRRALAELDARIAGAEAAQAEAVQAEADRAKPTGERAGKRAAALAGMALRFAAERVAMLRRSRAALTGKEPPG